MKKDYYEILGVPKESDLQQIKKAYRSLALKHHPDRVPENEKKAAEEKFKEISEAYGVLSDPQKRRMYDQHGHSGIDQTYTSEDIFKGADFSSIFEEAGLGDLFGRFFGEEVFEGGRRGSRQRRGQDIQYELEVTLEDAYHGIKKKIKVPRHDQCPVCNGNGAKPGAKITTCATCQGRGQVVMSSGFFRMAQTCSSCGGKGQAPSEYCGKCNGKGVVKVTREIDVTIPPGVDNDSRLRVRGEGEYGTAGRGDLYLYLYVKQHPDFERQGKDLYNQLDVSFVKAALGGEMSVATFDGDVVMKIPAGTQSGRVFRLREKGMPDVHGGAKGDLYVKVMIQVPASLTAEQRRLLEQFALISGEHPGPSEPSFKEKIKKVFK